jgi:pimeloyl-ACP methyl ester carboxylesterase
MSTRKSFYYLAVFFSVVVFSCSSDDKKSILIANEQSGKGSIDSLSQPAAPVAGFTHQIATVNGVNIHYVKGGEGELLVLIHGFGQNWYMWNRLLPELSKHFTVIAPDLPGVGESGKPETGYDKKTMATEVHELIKKLGYTNINLVGHDIGLMVAYAYAAQYGNEVKKLALLDALLPGVEPVWTNVSTRLWHFGFFDRPVAADLVVGQEEEFLKDFWPQQFGKDEAMSFDKDETNEFIRAYSVKGSIAGSFNWFRAFPQDIKDNREFMKHKLQMPVLSLAGEFSTASFLPDHLRLVAVNVKGVELKGAGHWLAQERPNEVVKELMDFFIVKK